MRRRPRRRRAPDARRRGRARCRRCWRCCSCSRWRTRAGGAGCRWSRSRGCSDASAAAILVWDAALADGPPADAAGRYLDVYTAERADGHGSALTLAGQPSDGVAPAAAFSLSLRRDPGLRALRRAAADGCGDRLRAADDAADGELLGYAAATPAPGTAALTELVAPDGCGAVYETDPDAAAIYVADGWMPGAVIGYVWPPGWGAPDATDADVAVAGTNASSAGTDGNASSAGTGGTAAATGAAPDTASLPTCSLGKNPALFLFYTGIDRTDDTRLLAGCPGEVVLGEKHMTRPLGDFASAAAHAAGGRTALVFGGNGSVFRDLLLRDNGVERTAAFIRARLAAGYDYVVVDEITTDPSWRDGSTVNRRFRQLLLRIPPRTLIAYVSLDLTEYPGGGLAMRDRRLLLRALKLRGRALALEDYLHTGAVMNGAAPATFRTAANRLVAAVHGMKGAAGVSRRAITTLGLSMHTAYPQYNYLDWRAHDLAAITREVTAIRHGSSRLRAEHGLGLYFVGRSDITPDGSTYTLADLVTRIHRNMLRFK